MLLLFYTSKCFLDFEIFEGVHKFQSLDVLSICLHLDFFESLRPTSDKTISPLKSSQIIANFSGRQAHVAKKYDTSKREGGKAGKGQLIRAVSLRFASHCPGIYSGHLPRDVARG